VTLAEKSEDASRELIKDEREGASFAAEARGTNRKSVLWYLDIFGGERRILIRAGELNPEF